MKYTENRRFTMKPKNALTRRSLLKTAAFGGGATMIIGPQVTLAGEDPPASVERETRPLSDFEEVLRRCGSEFGDVTDAS
jgi:hypothetical protein